MSLQKSKIIFIVGLPGSGKTFLARELLGSSKDHFILFDDIDDLKLLKVAIDNNKNCIITDPNLCFEKNRNFAEEFVKNCEAEWIFFENNPEQCLKNIEIRDDGRLVSSFINSYNKVYSIPEGSIIKKVYGS